MDVLGHINSHDGHAHLKTLQRLDVSGNPRVGKPSLLRLLGAIQGGALRALVLDLGHAIADADKVEGASTKPRKYHLRTSAKPASALQDLVGFDLCADDALLLVMWLLHCELVYPLLVPPVTARTTALARPAANPRPALCGVPS